MAPRKHLKIAINPAESPLRESQPTSGTPHPGFWKNQKLEWEIKSRTEDNVGGSSNNALAMSSGSVTNQKTRVIGPAPNQTAEEALSHQGRETATII